MDRTSVHGWASGLAYHTHLVVVLGTNEGREDGEEEEQKGEVAVRGTKLETGYFTPMAKGGPCIPSKLSWASDESPPCRSWSCRKRMMA